jgi:hypothetical protein
MGVAPRESDPDPLVSVVIPTYNRRDLVGQTVESVLGQSFRGFETIVVDDGSTDGTADLIEREYPSVRVVRQENAERSAAFNHGIREARGRYVAFLADDDLFEPWHLSQFEEAWRTAPDAPVFASTAWLWNPDTGRRKLLRDFDPSTVRRDAIAVGTVISPVCLFVDRHVLLEIGGFPDDRSLIGSEDWVLLLELVTRHEVMKLPRPSVRVRQHAGQSMKNLRVISDSREAATERLLQGEFVETLDDESRRLLAAGTHRLVAAHRYAAGEMPEARTHIRSIIGAVGWKAGVRSAGRLWLQTWLGPAGSTVARTVKDRITWRAAPTGDGPPT